MKREKLEYPYNLVNAMGFYLPGGRQVPYGTCNPELINRIGQALFKLDDDDRKLILQRFQDSLTFDQMAQTNGQGAGSVRRDFWRAIRHIKWIEYRL